jgi:ribosomal-protein-alanine N-acetyltransferase
MSVREALPGDLPRLRAIQAVTLAEPSPQLLTVGVDGPPICLVYASPQPTSYALAVTDGEEAYLAELAVANGYRGQGQGSTLVATLVDRLRARGVGTLRLTVRTVDTRARSFYGDRGFEAVSELPGRYAAGDGLLLERDL